MQACITIDGSIPKRSNPSLIVCRSTPSAKRLSLNFFLSPFTVIPSSPSGRISAYAITKPDRPSTVIKLFSMDVFGSRVTLHTPNPCDIIDSISAESISSVSSNSCT